MRLSIVTPLLKCRTVNTRQLSGCSFHEWRVTSCTSRCRDNQNPQMRSGRLIFSIVQKAIRD